MEQALDEVVATVEQARTLPMSASVVVHRGELLEQLARVRELLPRALTRAEAVLGDRQGVLAQAREEVEALRAEAEAERARLVERSSIHRQATAEAERLLAQAREQADALRVEVEDYVDAKLANFEVVLGKTLAAVQRGRTRLSGSTEMDELRSAPDQG